MPISVSQLRSLLGPINYYARFIPGLQGKCAPLHRLLQKGVKWERTTNDSQTVSELNSKLSFNDTLVHFDVNKPLVLSCDACKYGVGAELAHSFPDRTLRPIAFASRTLSHAEKKYSSIDREALALVFRVLKFHQYLYGRKFILYTDHKPLQYIFGPTANISRTATNRLQRWAVPLSVCNYGIQYRPSHLNSSADALSCLPLTTTTDASEKADIQHIRSVMFEDLPLTEKDLCRQTCNDKIQQQVLLYVRHGWPEKLQLASESLIPYFNKRDELSVDTNIIMWHNRAVISESMRSLILNALHEGHPGIAGMRSLARHYVRWLGIDNDVEHCLKT